MKRKHGSMIFVYPLWGAAIIMFVLRVLYLTGIQIPGNIFPTLLKILLIWSGLIFVSQLFPPSENKLERFHFLSEECAPNNIRETMYIRARCAAGREERYLVDLYGHVYYRIISHYGMQNAGRLRIFDVFQGNETRIGTIHRNKLGCSDMQYMLTLQNQTYYAEIQLGDRKEVHLSNSEPYIFQFNDYGGISAYHRTGTPELAKTKGVLTELGHSCVDHDVLFLCDDKDPVLLLLLAAFTLDKNTGSYYDR